jgi:DNA polymerase III delta prime subunit
MKIGTILQIITRDFREQLTCRKYFSTESTLIKEGIIIYRDCYDCTTNIFNMVVHLHERVVNYLLGEKRNYNVSLRGISRDRRPIELERVILPDNIKEEILHLAESYSRDKSRKEKLEIDRFYGYGMGLAFLFYGPSGTGKTMLAHALAHRLNKNLLSLNMEEAGNGNVSFEGSIKYIFREAKLSGGIVFFDECDDFFREGLPPSRALLIEIEKSDCITILATNKIGELDPSLDRRITMRVPFYLPDEDQRREIWRASIPPNIALGKNVDFKALAQKFVLTGGLIKNAIFMAIQNYANRNGGSKFSLDLPDLEKTAAYQSASMVNQQGSESIYKPKIRLEDVGIRSQDKKFFQRLISVYERFQGDALGMNFVIGSSDIQTGIDCVEGVAKACNLNVKKLPFFNVIYNERYSSGRRESLFSEKKEILLDQAFTPCPGKQALVLFVDNDLIFQQLLYKYQENPTKDLAAFLEKLRSFQGLFFLVTKPVKKQHLPIEIHHYIEIKYPPEELQIRRWEIHLKNSDCHQDELINLVEHYPMHLHEIDFIARQANISAILNGSEEKLRLEYIHELINKLREKKETPVLFGGKN